MEEKLYEIIGQLYTTYHSNVQQMNEMNNLIQTLTKQLDEKGQNKQGIKVSSSNHNQNMRQGQGYQDDSFVESNSELSEVNG